MDIFDNVGVNARAFDETTENTGEEVLCWGVFEAATTTFGKRRSEGAGYYYVVRVLFEKLVAGGGAAGGELVCNLGEASRGWES